MKIHFTGSNYLLREVIIPISYNYPTAKWVFKKSIQNEIKNVAIGKTNSISITCLISGLIKAFLNFSKTYKIVKLEYFQRKTFSKSLKEPSILDHVYFNMLCILKVIIGAYDGSFRYNIYIVNENVYLNRMYVLGLKSSCGKSLAISSQYNNIHVVYNSLETGFLNPKNLNKINIVYSQEEFQTFSKLRRQGNVRNPEVKQAFFSTTDKRTEEFDLALILHVFGDSQFQHINEKRIFKTHLEAAKETIKMSIELGLRILVKFHPSSLKWGENPEAIATTYFNQLDSPFIYLDTKNEYTSKAILESTNTRIITYSGSIALESLFYNKTPIVLNSIGSFFDDFVEIPLIPKDYKEMLVSKKFIQNRGQDLLFIKEKLFSTTEKQFNVPYLYFNENIETSQRYKKLHDFQTENIRLYQNLKYSLENYGCHVLQ